MDARADIVRALAAEPHKQFSTTQIVEAVYPPAMRSVREQLQYGTKEQQAVSQNLKSKLHRKVLYHIGRLLSEGILEVARMDAHGEKIYSLKEKTVRAETKKGIVTITQHAPRIATIETELENNICQLYESASVLSRVNSIYLDATAVKGLGELLQYTESALKAVNDTVCVGDFQQIITRYTIEDLEHFLSSLAIATLDQAASVCLLIDNRNTEVASFVQLYVNTLPKRVSILFVTDHRSLQTKDFSLSVKALQERHEKINVHYAPLHPYPLYLGRAGVYGIQENTWQSYKTDYREQTPCFVASQATVLIDMKKIMKAPAHTVRDVILRTAKALYSIASQQRLIETATQPLSAINQDTSKFFHHAAVTLRLWNYDWESSAEVIASVAEPLTQFARTQETIYRACGLPFHFDLILSSAFSKFGKNLSVRSYRKWMITGPRDLDSESFTEYCQQRLVFAREFGNIDRFRVFRAGNPTSEQVANEIVHMCQRGFPLVTIDFQELQGVKKLTDYFL